jgi:hypothetical protein
MRHINEYVNPGQAGDFYIADTSRASLMIFSVEEGDSVMHPKGFAKFWVGLSEKGIILSIIQAAGGGQTDEPTDALVWKPGTLRCGCCLTSPCNGSYFR